MIRNTLAVVGVCTVLAVAGVWFLLAGLNEPGAWTTRTQPTGSGGT